MEGGEGSSSGTTPFVKQLYAMVNDPSTNAVISWGSSGTSFIIWHHLTLEREILPKIFKHRNLSSFVYQLNNYGFRKIGVIHEWEYENPYFQAGKESWLVKIESRNQKRKQTPCSNTTNNALEIELEILKNEIEESKLEIKKLKKKHAEMELQIEELKNTTKSEKLTMLLAKACREIHVEETNKKRKMGNLEIPTENEEMNAGTENEKVDQNQEEILEGELNPLPEKQYVGVSSDESGNHVDKGTGFNLNSEPNEKNESDYAYWEQMMFNDDNCEVCDNGEGSDWKRKGQVEIAAELEGLIANLPNQDTKPVITAELEGLIANLTNQDTKPAITLERN